MLGNPSDGYAGKTIALSIRDFQAEVQLRPAARLTIQPSAAERDRDFDSIHDFARQLDLYGLYGGVRLVKAAIRRFYDHCLNRHCLHTANFSVTYETNIPRSVGLAGSSAIIVATLRALVNFYNVPLSRPVVASLAWSAEKDLLGISAGLMDRVIQSLEGLVYMDFSETAMQLEDDLPVGIYEPLPVGPWASGLFLAWAQQAAEPTEVLHNRLQERFARGDDDVRQAMTQFALIAEQGRAALLENDTPGLSRLIDANFDLRASICQLPKLHQQMVLQARQAGAAAKFCGSGGAIIGTAPDPETFQRVVCALVPLGCEVIRPQIH